MSFRPLHDRVLVRRVESEEKTAGGIIIPASAQEKPQEGIIVAVGSGTRDEAGNVTPLEVKPGERVLFGKWSGTEVKIDGEELLIMKESDVMGVIEVGAAPKAAASKAADAPAKRGRPKGSTKAAAAAKAPAKRGRPKKQ